MICRRCKQKESTHIFHCDDCYTCRDCGTVKDLVTRCDGLLCPSCWKKIIEERVNKFDASTDFTNEIVCPWCGCVNSDSWECSDEEDDRHCSDCGNVYSYVRDIEVTYSSAKVIKKEN